MNAKRFFYVSAGILLLVIAYGVGAHRVEAQGGGDFTGIAVHCNGLIAIKGNGDLYFRTAYPAVQEQGGGVSWWSSVCSGFSSNGWQYAGNVSGGPIAVEGKSMSDVKGSYRK